ncbi:MAG: MFS transporter [Dermabacter sp.]|nr:MFS transporter [Dermabacter sp.]
MSSFPVAPREPGAHPALRKAASASFIGNFVEWFDYASYGYLATVIAIVFFPSDDPTASLLLTFGVFALSFILRPIGAVVWGNWGDRFGRRWALSWSILLMSGSTFLIGLLPGYATIGILAPIALLVLRMIQGFSASGEYAGASIFLAEYSSAKRRGLLTSIVPASTAAGLLMGSLFATGLHTLLSEADMHAWGWRIPFLLAGPLGLVGRYIRVHLEDSPEYLAMVKGSATNAEHHTPLRTLLRHHWRTTLIAFGVASLNAVAFYVLLSYMPTYLSAELGMGDTESFLASTITLAVYVGFIFVMGHISDAVGRKRMLITACVLFILCSVPLFWALGGAGFWVVVLVEVAFVAILTMNDGTLPTFLSESFPTQVRYSGFAVSFNLANALLGGTAPLVCTWLISLTGSVMAPAWYLVAISVVALGAMIVAPTPVEFAGGEDLE